MGKQYALVTGASSGIGRDMVYSLAKRGYNVIIVARNVTALDEVKKDVEEKYNGIEIIPIGKDLSVAQNCIDLHKEIFDKYGTIDVVINNAGFGLCGNFYETDMDKEMKMIDTNITAVHILTKLFLQDMVKADKGHIMNVASIAGFMPGPLMATYYATKAYVVRLTQAINRELKMEHSNVKVSALCPGPVATNFAKTANVKFGIGEQKSDFVAEYGIKNMFKNKLLIFPSFSVALARLFAKVYPDTWSAYFCYFVQKRKMD